MSFTDIDNALTVIDGLLNPPAMLSPDEVVIVNGELDEFVGTLKTLASTPPTNTSPFTDIQTQIKVIAPMLTSDNVTPSQATSLIDKITAIKSKIGGSGLPIPASIG